MKILRLFVLFALLAFASSALRAAVVPLENSSWQLVEIRDLGDSRFVPNNPQDYLLRFRLENRLQIEADCNQAGATWRVEGESLSLTGLVSTRKLCPAPTLFNRYIMHIENVQSFALENERLTLITTGGNVRLVFEPYVFTPGG